MHLRCNATRATNRAIKHIRANSRVLSILKVRYVGVHPKYLVVKRVMTDPVEWEKKSNGDFRVTKGGKKIHKAKVPAKWVWADQLIGRHEGPQPRG